LDDGLRVFEEPPREAEELGLEEFLHWVGRPALFRLAGRDESRTRLLVGGLHGNEPSGFAAIHDLLRSPPQLACTTWLFLGNVPAAILGGGFRHRCVPGSEDLNRVWGIGTETAPRRIATRVLEVLADEPLEAVADLHNNTGYNPVYSVLLGRDARRLGIARHWTNLFVRYGGETLNTLLEMFHERAPGAVLECGQAGAPEADEAAIRGARSFLHAENPFVGGAELRDNERIYRSVARITIPPEVDVVFAKDETDADLTVAPGLDVYNFLDLPADTLLAYRQPRGRLLVHDRRGQDVTGEWLRVEGREIRTQRTMVPVMMTTSAEAAKSDCLLYVAEVVEQGPGS
jgi:hypothetical protein